MGKTDGGGKAYRKQLIPWCSGYHVSLTHSRSPVRSRVESAFSPFFVSLYILSSGKKEVECIS